MTGRANFSENVTDLKCRFSSGTQFEFYSHHYKNQKHYNHDRFKIQSQAGSKIIQQFI